MKRHGVSHGAATLVTTVASALLVEQLGEHLPLGTRLLEAMARQITARIAFGLDPKLVGPVLLASCLATVWGMAFALANRRATRGR